MKKTGIALFAAFLIAVVAQSGIHAQATVRPAGRPGADIAQVGEALQRMELALLRNLPTTLSCTVEIALTRPDPKGAWIEAAQLRPLQLLWKNPASACISFADGLPPAPPAAAQDDPSTTATRGPYFDLRMGTLMTQMRKASRVNRLNGLGLSPLQTFVMMLRADARAKFLGRTLIEGHPVVGMDFPNVISAIPMGMTAKRAKLWINESDGLPVRIRLFTQREGVLTFDIVYAARKDAGGVEYLLPELVTLQPAEEEDLPSAAYPMRIRFADYKLNVEIADAKFE